MINKQYDLAIIGGGPAGLAAAHEARKQGIESIIILERDKELGGILNQCIHNGFGLHIFKEELTGPEYAHKFIELVQDDNIEYKLNTMVLDITKDKVITATSHEGIIKIKAKAVILAMGCRERPRGAINIPGKRCAGILTAGAAQKFVNREGYMPGKKVVILGSGDIGLIMARRMTLEGAKVKAVVEVMPYSGGLNRNIVQCLEDFNIPLKLSHSVIEIKGEDRVQGVVIAEVDEKRQPIAGTEEYISCDTLLLSVGLLPENELSKKAEVELSPITGGAVVNQSLETSVDGIFACGNVLHVHDLVDNVTRESFEAGKSAAEYIKNLGKQSRNEEYINIVPGEGVRYTMPSKLNVDDLNENSLTVRFRTGNVYEGKSLKVYFDDKEKISRKKKIMVPGEMESLVLTKELLEENKTAKTIRICVE